MDEMLSFRRNALLADLCKEWDGMWMACGTDKEKLMRLALQQQSAPYFATFCYNGKGLTKEYCLEQFGKLINGKWFDGCDNVSGYLYGMYIDTDTAYIPIDVAQFLWCEDTDVIIKKTKCPVLYVSNKSHIRLCCEGFSCVKIYLFDESVVTLSDIDEESSVTVYRYSENAKVETGRYCLSQKIKVFDKKLKL